MNAWASPHLTPPAGNPVVPLLRAVLLADLVDSTAFVQRYGDARAAVALRRLDLQIRDLLEFTGGRLIDKADGLLAIFERPIQAVDFALRYQQALRHFSASEGAVLTARVGIHVGEVMTWSNSAEAVAAGAKPLEVEGLAKPIAARLMSLALPGQILISSMAMTLAQRAEAELGERAQRVRWLAHGRYRFKGVPTPLIVHEVGETGFAPLRQPSSGAKVWREQPIWRRPPVLVAEVLVFLGLAGFYAYGLLRSPPALAFNERDWVVVGDISNFTGDPRLEESLETALRISLEQSRFVNAVPDLKVQEVLQRMGRSQQASVDRAIGSEIALREGARALLLPSVAEVGGRLRVSIEVVDPSNQATVFAESAEGRGVDSALASLDKVNAGLRERLGESLGEVKANGKPLAQVTTANIDALRAYSLARDTYFAGRFKEAIELYKQALSIDPDFAMAYIGLGRIYQSSHQSDLARAAYAEAGRRRQRISQREALTLDAYVAGMGDPVPSQAKWKLLSTIYPDAFEGYYAYALRGWADVHNYADSIAFLTSGMSDKQVRRGSSYYLLGVLHLVRDEFPAAIAAFKQSEQLQVHGYIRQYAEAFAAQRDYRQAELIVKRQSGVGMEGVDLQSRLDEILFPADRGRLVTARASAESQLAEARKVSPVDASTYEGIRLSLLSYEPDAKFAGTVRGFVQSALANTVDSEYPEPEFAVFSALYGGWLATRAGDSATGRLALARVRDAARKSGYVVLPSMADVLAAELQIGAGEADKAIELLRSRQDGTELYISHSVLMRAYASVGRNEDALHEANWLAGRRGLAYAEWSAAELPKPVNIIESNLALLASAEYLLDLGQPVEARKRLVAFRRAWPSIEGQEQVRQRVAAVAARLSRSRSRPGST